MRLVLNRSVPRYLDLGISSIERFPAGYGVTSRAWLIVRERADTHHPPPDLRSAIPAGAGPDSRGQYDDTVRSRTLTHPKTNCGTIPSGANNVAEKGDRC